MRNFCSTALCLLTLALSLPTDAVASSELWAKLQDVRAEQAAAAEPDWDKIMAAYDALLAELGREDVLKYEVMYWKARALYEAGKHAESRVLMQDAANHFQIRNQAVQFLVESGAWENRVHKLPHSSGFLVDETGQSDSQTALVWRGAFDVGARSLRAIELQCKSQTYPLMLTVELLDWRNEAWVWRGTIKGREQIALTTSDFRKPRVQDKTFFRAITISAESFDGRAVPIEIQRLSLR